MGKEYKFLIHKINLMKKIIVRKGNEMKVKELVRMEIDYEGELQELISENPSIIPIDEIREGSSELVFAVKEFGTDLGSIDVLAFNPDGDIAIIECKILDRPSKIYEAVGQILTYASGLWGMSYKELDEKIKDNVKRSLGVEKSLLECIKENFDGRFSEEEFVNGVNQNLRNGSFILILVVDKIDDRLKKVINYINEHSEYAFSIHALEISKFTTEDGIEILIPHVYGISTKPTSATLSRMPWDEDKFFKVLKEKHPEIVNTIREIYEWCKSIGEIRFGRGAKVGTFDFIYKVNDIKVKIFAIDTDGRLWMAFGDIQRIVNEQMLNEFRRRARETIRSLGSADKWPAARISEAFRDENDLKEFKKLIEEFISKIAKVKSTSSEAME